MKFTRDTLLKSRLVILALGVLISWTTTIEAFANFYKLEGTLFKIRDCILPNPVTTPCFWGALAFFVALLWAYNMYKKNHNQEKYFLWFMVGSVIFAWVNFAIELRGIKAPPGSLIAPCPTTTSSPFTSACFFGSILFTLSLASTYLVKKSSDERLTSA